MPDGGVAIYVHLPFCPYICPYCDFAKWAYRRSDAERYLDALLAQIESAPRVQATTLFFGGGTPNAYEAAAIAQIVARVRARFALPDDAEVSLEANPESRLVTDLAGVRAAGVNRLSIGAQSFDPGELATLGRRHSPDEIDAAVRGARAAGFENVSLDLIFAVPGQTPASFARSLDRAVGSGVTHLSTYGLTVETGTPYERWREREPSAFADDVREAELYEMAMDRLEAAGFEHYEISNFARPGYRSAHNATYWANGEYLGLGVGAASYRDGVRSVATRNLEEYIEAALGRREIPAESERLDGDERLGEATMLALRTAEGVDVRRFRERYEVDFLSKYQPVIEEFRAAALLCVDDGRVRLTRRGRFLANDVCGAFLNIG